MILVDSSVWSDYLRSGDTRLAQLLLNGRVLTHPFVIGELACGNLKNRKSILSLLSNLPTARAATHEEVRFFIEKRNLSGKGLGYIDAHLLSSVFLGEATQLWTRDKRLDAIASAMKVNFVPL